MNKLTLKKEKLVNIKLLLWDIANYLSKYDSIDLIKFNEFAINNNIEPKKKQNKK